MTSTNKTNNDGNGVALLLIDLQPEWYSQNPVISKLFPNLGENVKTLLQVCRNCKIEIVHVRALYSKENNSKWMSEFMRLNPEKGNPEIDGTYEVEEFAKEIDNEMLILKSCYDGFSDTSLHAHLQKKNITRVLCAGLITSACVQHTAHGAFSRGYRVDLIEDCCADRNMERHKAALLLYGNYMYTVMNVKKLAEEFSTNS
jgi:nicotinamidase-related amidase